MTKARRVSNFITGLFMIIGALLIAIAADRVYPLIIAIFGISLLLAGARSLVYYCSMARHMVGGRTVLYRAIIILDMGVFTLALTDVPLYCVVIYLAVIHGFAGFVDIMRAVESKRLQAPSWKLNLSTGVINIILAALCVVFIGVVEVAVLVYAAGLAYSGAVRMIQSFRRAKILYGDAPAV